MVEYQLPGRWVDKVIVGGRKLGNVSLKFQAQNLFVLADKRLQGYETINYTTTSYGSLPLARTFTLGLNINF